MNGIRATQAFLRSMGLPDHDLRDLPSSDQRFPDGGQWRIEIPSVEGPNALRTVYQYADEYGVPIHRVSQGSGVMLLTDDELDEMAALGRQRGMEQVVQGVEEVRRALAHGIGSVLVTDEGLLWVLGRMKAAGELPASLILKGSVMLGASNPVSVRLLQEAGLTTFNAPTDLSLAQLAAIRAATTMPLDLYIEVPDDIGGFVRHYEIAEIVRIAAPVYLKFGLRNAPNIYPSGTHLEATAIALTKERLRRAKIGLDLLHRLDPAAVMSPVPKS